MSATESKREIQKRNLLKILNKLYRTDLNIICREFSVTKSGRKTDLIRRLTELIDSDKDFKKLRKRIREVYNSNDKIKKLKIKDKTKDKSSQDKSKDEPKGKRKKKKKTPKKSDHHLQRFLANCVANAGPSDSDGSDQSSLWAPMPAQRQSYESVNSSNDLDLLDFTIFDHHFQSTNSCSDNSSSEWSPRAVIDNEQNAQPLPQFGQTSATNDVNARTEEPRPDPRLRSRPQPPLRPPQTTDSAPHPMRPLPPNVNPFQTMMSSHFQHLTANNYFAQRLNSAANVPIRGQAPNPVANRVPYPPTLQQIPNVYNQQNYNNYNNAIDFSVNNNNYYPTSGQSNAFHPNSYNEPNPVSDILNPNNFGSLIEQQKLLLSQYPNSFQDNTDRNSDSDVSTEVPIIGHFVFKSLPKYKVIKTLMAPKTIGSLSDIGSQIEFRLNAWDLDPSFPPNPALNNMHERLGQLLCQNSLRVVLRFSYITDVNVKEQKDLLPEHLCIDCNDKRVFTYDQSAIGVMSPFDLSANCRLGTNRIKFWLSKDKFTFLMPCIYEITLAETFTPDRHYEQLNNNLHQKLSSEVTKQLIKSRNEQSVTDDTITIVSDTDTKLKLICPLSCKRIELPIRTVDCKHIECFDAYSFFTTNDSRYDWICPICQKSAEFDRLRIDGYMSEVLSETAVSITEIFIKPDATYDLKQSGNDSEVIDLDDSTLDSEYDCEVSVIDADGCIVLD